MIVVINTPVCPQVRAWFGSTFGSVDPYVSGQKANANLAATEILAGPLLLDN
jgi:hypothetical protein